MIYRLHLFHWLSVVLGEWSSGRLKEGRIYLAFYSLLFVQCGSNSTSVLHFTVSLLYHVLLLPLCISNIPLGPPWGGQRFWLELSVLKIYFVGGSAWINNTNYIHLFKIYMTKWLFGQKTEEWVHIRSLGLACHCCAREPESSRAVSTHFMAIWVISLASMLPFSLSWLPFLSPLVALISRVRLQVVLVYVPDRMICLDRSLEWPV